MLLLEETAHSKNWYSWGSVSLFTCPNLQVHYDEHDFPATGSQVYSLSDWFSQNDSPRTQDSNSCFSEIIHHYTLWTWGTDCKYLK